MNILVTGAGGYIGRHLVPRLRAEGHEVRGVTRRDVDLAHSPRTEMDEWWTAGDYLVDRLPEADTVIHLAGRVDIALRPNPDGLGYPVPGEQDIATLYRDNVLTTANVLDYCLRAGVKHLIYASTQAVYGVPNYDDWGTLVESPLEQYAASKLAAEMMLETACLTGLQVTTLRLPGIYGGDRRTGVIWRMCESAVREGVVRLESTMPLPWSCLHIEDAVNAFVAALSRTGAYMVVDIADTEPHGLQTVAADIAELAGVGLQESGPMADILRTDADRTRVFLRWTPKPRRERLLQVLEEVRRAKLG